MNETAWPLSVGWPPAVKLTVIGNVVLVVPAVTVPELTEIFGSEIWLSIVPVAETPPFASVALVAADTNTENIDVASFTVSGRMGTSMVALVDPAGMVTGVVVLLVAVYWNWLPVPAFAVPSTVVYVRTTGTLLIADRFTVNA